MHLLDLTLESLDANLALDEALLLDAEAGGPALLRLWQWPSPAVILGAGGKLAEDVDEVACRADGVPILRRGSGGGTVLLGPGCLLFSLVLAFDADGALAQVRSSYAWILGRIAAGFAQLGIPLQVAGTSDLVLEDRKVSGNAQQRKRTHLLHHGTLLYAFDHALTERYLKMPARQPDYRRQRSHADFLGNIPATAPEICRLLCRVWNADEPLAAVPHERTARLVADKYESRHLAPRGARAQPF